MSYFNSAEKPIQLPYSTSSAWRNIPTAHPSKNLYYPGQLTEYEATIAQYYGDLDSIDRKQPQHYRWHQYGDNENYLEHVFQKIENPKSRFTDGSFPVWYAANSAEVSIREVAYHLQKQAQLDLSLCTKESSIRFERAMCRAKLSFNNSVDIRNLTNSHPELFSKTKYTSSIKFAKELRAENADGIITRSVRAEGDCYAVFTPRVILESKNVNFVAITIYNDLTRDIDVSKDINWFTIPKNKIVQ